MSWGLVAAGSATVIGAGVSAHSAGKATDAAIKGGKKQIKYAEESRDMARADQAPYREAGATALDALMSMTGLGVTGFGARERQRNDDVSRVTGQDYLASMRGVLGKKGRKQLDRYLEATNYEGGVTDDSQYISNFTNQLGSRSTRRAQRFQQQNPYGRARGGVIGRTSPVGMAPPPQFNINEEGPENVYQGGAVTRNPNPQTIEPTTDGYVQPNENPGGMEGGYNFQTDPGYNFRIGEGMRVLERGAAARGGVLSGGFGRKAIRYGQNYASNEYQNVYNRIATIAGFGPTASAHSGRYSMYAGDTMGTAAANNGMTGAYGDMARGNAWATAANDIASMDWDRVFKRNGDD